MSDHETPEAGNYLVVGHYGGPAARVTKQGVWLSRDAIHWEQVVAFENAGDLTMRPVRLNERAG